MRGLVAIALVLLLAGATAASGASGSTALRIVFRAKAGARAAVTTLRCGPPRGTARDPARACRLLAAGGRALFVPTPPGRACSQIYGGPQHAVVTGTLGGARVWAQFGRRDGCELARWDRVAFLFPAR